MVLRRLCGGALRVGGWRVTGAPPRTGVLVGAPHTSNWDFLLMLLVMGSTGARPLVLMKRELFRPPLGWFLRRIGGVPVDRRHPAGVVRDLVTRAGGDESFLLVLAAEGTRSRAEYWKSGFHRIARMSGLPITLGYLDGPTRTAGFGPTFHATDDLAADMDLVRAFYADKRGLRPERRTEPRLREESADG